MNLGLTIRNLRKLRNYRQGEFARICGLTQPRLSLIELGRRMPSEYTLRTISNHLNVPVGLIFMASLEIDNDIPTAKRDLFESLFPEFQKKITLLL